MMVQQQLLKKVWNLADTSRTARMWTRLTLPNVTTHRKVKIPSVSPSPFPMIDLHAEKKKKKEESQAQIQSRQRSSSISSQMPPTRHTRSISMSFLETPVVTEVQIAKKYLIPARVLSMRPLPLKSSKRSGKVGEGPVTLVIHFHGGGFIAMSSFSHQDYVRLWCKYLDRHLPCAILSVDYR
jgi:acetyl esterase/lipase